MFFFVCMGIRFACFDNFFFSLLIFLLFPFFHGFLNFCFILFLFVCLDMFAALFFQPVTKDS